MQEPVDLRDHLAPDFLQNPWSHKRLWESRGGAWKVSLGNAANAPTLAGRKHRSPEGEHLEPHRAVRHISNRGPWVPSPGTYPAPRTHTHTHTSAGAKMSSRRNAYLLHSLLSRPIWYKSVFSSCFPPLRTQELLQCFHL